MEVTSISTFGCDAVVVKEWKQTPVQNQVIQLPDTVFEALGGGAAGGGKTDLGLMIPPIRQFTEHPKFKALVMRRTLTDLEKEIIPRQHEWYGGMGAIYNENKKVWRFPSGARIQNGHAEREQDVRKYDSAEYNYIDWDESTHFTGFQYLYLSISRCRSSSPDLPAFVRAFTNPGNIGHAFFKKRFVDSFPAGRRILKDKITKQKRIYIPFLGKDNPYLLINDPTYLQRLEGLPEIEKRAKLFGDWNSYEGQVFSEFRVARLSDEPEYAVHVISPFAVPAWWPKILCIDWGWDAMTFVIWSAISPSGRVYIYRTWHCQKVTTAVWARDVVNMSGEDVFEDVVICHSAGQHKGEPKTIQEQIYEAFDQKYEIRLADRDRVGGKNMIHEYLRWTQKPTLLTPEVHYDHELAGKIFRIYGEEKYNDYLRMFVPEPPETNLPKLQIFSHSYPQGWDNDVLIDVIPTCIPNENNPEDVAEFPGDDPYDTLRMVVKAAYRYVDQSAAEMARRLKIEEFQNAAKTVANQTAYYLQMAKIEAETPSGGSIRSHRRLGNRRFSN